MKYSLIIGCCVALAVISSCKYEVDWSAVPDILEDTGNGDDDDDNNDIIIDDDDDDDDDNLDGCTPGEEFCIGNEIHICKADKTTRKVDECDDETQVCINGVCAMKLCEPASIECEETGEVSVTCNVYGTAIESRTVCDEDEFCNRESGKCEGRVCSPGERICEDNGYKECDGRGTGYGDVVACEAGQECQSGTCVNTSCEADELTCVGNEVWKCKSDNSGFELDHGCTSGEYCEGGECKHINCKPLEKRCEGDTVMQCDSLGKAETVLTKCEGGAPRCDVDSASCVECLSDGDCGSDVCNVNTNRCEDPCNGKECGTFSGKNCGSCTGGETCNTSTGVCQTTCVPDCDDKCGGASDGCGGKCNDECDSGKVCQSQTCVPCGGNEQPCCDGDSCNSGYKCQSGACTTDCTADCTGKECGDDGCGGNCGTCDNAPAPECINENTLRIYIVPGECDDKGKCSYDYSDQTCGYECDNGVCTDCEPDCDDKCGGASDGCGGSCNASCPSGKVCSSQTCVPCGQIGEPCCVGDSCTEGICTSGTCQVVGWYDSNSNLTWMVNPSVNKMEWAVAVNYCNGLSGGWHLPTISELRSLLRGCPATETGGSCGLTDSCLSESCISSSCDGCSENGGPDNGCYWPNEIEGTCMAAFLSSSSYATDTNRVLFVYFRYGSVGHNSKTSIGYIRCVSAGP